MGKLSDSLELHLSGAYNLVQVRDLYRRLLHRSDPHYFVWGRFTSLLMLLESSLKLDGAYAETYLECTAGHRSDFDEPRVPILDVPVGDVPITSLQSWLSEGAPRGNVRRPCPYCNDNDDVVRQIPFTSAPALFCFNLGSAELADINWFLEVVAGADIVMYDLVGLVYFGQSHFVARFVDRHGVLWFHDGIANGGSFISGGYAEDHAYHSLSQHHGAWLAVLVYIRRDGEQWRF